MGTPDELGQPTFTIPDAAARGWIRNSVEAMQAYLRDSGRLEAGEPVSPTMLDEAWVDLREDWKASEAGDRAIKDAINQVGLAFGQILVDRLGMNWVIASDSRGKDFAVRGESGWVVYPRDILVKRRAGDESGFLTELFHVIEERS